MNSSKEEYYLLKKQYDDAIKKDSDWECSLAGRFNEDEELDIMSLVSYWSNQLDGFGHLNDEQEHKRICKEDINGILYKEAKIGFEYSKKCYELFNSIRELENKNKHFKSKKV